MNWDKYYFEMCNTVALNSKCLSRKIGSIIVKDKSVISTGYNSPSRNIPHCGVERYLIDSFLRDALNKKGLYEEDCKNTCPRQLLGFKSGEGLEYCIAGHSERNAILNAARHGISVKDSIMYMNCNVPCKDCLIEIINVGIVEIVCVDSSCYYDSVSKFLVQESGLIVRDFHFEKNWAW
jgi:dCMP deaminase